MQQIALQLLQITQNNDTAILTGDFNAKIEIKKTNINQGTHTNGKMLEEIMKQMETRAISVDANQGIWTRVNRNNTEERSVIDYIIMPKKDTSKIKESDHNTIIITIDQQTKIYKQTKMIWKKGNWTQFNQTFNRKHKETKIEDYNRLEK